MLVKDIMTPKPITIDPDKTLHDALRIMYQHDIRRLPVTEGKKLVGIISDRDIKQVVGRPTVVSRLTSEEELKLSVREVMTRNVVTVEHDTDLREAIELMVENKFGGLPVVDRDQNVVGIVSEIDILRYSLDLIDRIEGR
jgi:acetoin utilization protein AcuB